MIPEQRGEHRERYHNDSGRLTKRTYGESHASVGTGNRLQPAQRVDSPKVLKQFKRFTVLKQLSNQGPADTPPLNGRALSFGGHGRRHPRKSRLNSLVLLFLEHLFQPAPWRLTSPCKAMLGLVPHHFLKPAQLDHVLKDVLQRVLLSFAQIRDLKEKSPQLIVIQASKVVRF
jgi:hypothetical protein